MSTQIRNSIFNLTEGSGSGGSYWTARHPELKTYVTGLTTPLSTPEIVRIGTLIEALKTGLNITSLSEAFDKIDLRGERVDVSLKNLVKDSSHSVLAGTPVPTHIRTQGYLSDGANGYINTGFNAVAHGVRYTQNNASFGMFSRTDVDNTSTQLGVNGGTYLSNLVLRSGNQLQFRLNADLSTTATPCLNSKGVFIVSRTTASLTTPYVDGVAGTTTAELARALQNLNFFSSASNSSGTPGGYSTRVISVEFYGRGFTAPEVTVIKNAFYDYMEDLSIWKPQGTVLAFNNGNEDDNLFEPSIINEDGLFKMWYTRGWSAPNICYATSPTGLPGTWMDYGIVVAGYNRGFVLKVSGVYYLYAAPSAQNTINLFTSNDGIAFFLDTVGVITLGAVGAWDSTYVANTSVIIEGGVWYMYYDGLKTGEGWSTGLATSNDGRTFTKHATNPVINIIPFTAGATYVRKVGTNYYIWLLESNVDGVLPSDIWRYKSTDLITWTKDTHKSTFERSTVNEGYGNAVGQVGDVFLIEVSGKVYMYYIGTPDGSASTGDSRIKLAIANMTFEQLVLTQEGNHIVGVE